MIVVNLTTNVNVIPKLMNLKEYLDKNKVTQREFAEKLDVHIHSLKNIVYGKRKPSLELALRIEEFSNGDVLPNDLLNHFNRVQRAAQKPKKRKKKSK